MRKKNSADCDQKNSEIFIRLSVPSKNYANRVFLKRVLKNVGNRGKFVGGVCAGWTWCQMNFLTNSNIFLFSNGDFAATLKSRTLGLAGKLYAWHRKSNKKLAVKPTLQQCNVASLDVKIKEMLIIQHKLRKQACESSEDAVAR